MAGARRRRRPAPGRAGGTARGARRRRRRLPGPQSHRRARRPMIDGAATLAEAIGAGAISSREAVEACLAAIESVNGELNAVVQAVPGRARAEAIAADERLAAGDDVGPLHGVPITIKDCF